MSKIQLLWVDDEIELLKPHILFLKEKEFETHPCNNGLEAIELVKNQPFDAVLLDENMPGLSGLETLAAIKIVQPNLPVIMVTKNEEELIMNEAIGGKISDYLIKPVNPNQILLSLKKTLQQKHLVSEKTIKSYQQAFREISLSLNTLNDADQWIDFYQKLLFWELELENLEDLSMLEMLEAQKQEANIRFAKFVDEHYAQWIDGKDRTPVLSHQLMKQKVFPQLTKKSNTLMVVIDNLRMDQWKVISPFLNDNFRTLVESAYFSILPTATQYARNALFSGLTPYEMDRHHPQWWKKDHEEGSKNLFEKEFFSACLERNHKNLSWSYHKITQLQAGKNLVKNLTNHQNEQLTIVVYNFVDMISHAKTEMEIIKELAADDKAYRSLTRSWFRNSPLSDLLQKARQLGSQVIITTDHGTLNVAKPSEVISQKEASLNLRYKTGRSLTFKPNDVVQIATPHKFGLPADHLNSEFIFAKDTVYFVYKNQYNHYAKLFKNTFQHGGISMEEMIVPFVVLRPR